MDAVKIEACDLLSLFVAAKRMSKPMENPYSKDEHQNILIVLGVSIHKMEKEEKVIHFQRCKKSKHSTEKCFIFIHRTSSHTKSFTINGKRIFRFLVFQDIFRD